MIFIIWEDVAHEKKTIEIDLFAVAAVEEITRRRPSGSKQVAVLTMKNGEQHVVIDSPRTARRMITQSQAEMR